MSFFNRHFFVGMFFGAVVLAIIGIGGLGAFAVAVSSFMEGGRQQEAPFGDVPEFPTDPAAPPAMMAWALTSLDGDETYLGEFGDAAVFVNNWATWCAPCVREMPSIESLAERYQGRSLAFVIVSTEPLSLVRDFVEEKGWNLPVFVAEHRPPIFQTKGIPSTFVLTPSPTPKTCKWPSATSAARTGMPPNPTTTSTASCPAANAPRISFARGCRAQGSRCLSCSGAPPPGASKLSNAATFRRTAADARDGKCPTAQQGDV